jgi:hypothetical protein
MTSAAPLSSCTITDQQPTPSEAGVKVTDMIRAGQLLKVSGHVIMGNPLTPARNRLFFLT